MAMTKQPTQVLNELSSPVRSCESCGAAAEFQVVFAENCGFLPQTAQICRKTRNPVYVSAERRQSPECDYEYPAFQICSMRHEDICVVVAGLLLP